MSARDQLRAAVRSGDRERVLRVTLEHVATVDPDDVTIGLWPWQDALDRFYPGGDGIDLVRHDFSTVAGRRAATMRIAKRLRRHFASATRAERDEGREWYDEAHTIAVDCATRYGYTVEQCAYVLAALSPNVSWAQNVHGLHLACTGHMQGRDPIDYGGSGYHANRVKAARILSGDLSALQGPKVTQFAAGILGDPSACTVDVWMQRACGLDSGAAPTTNEHKVIRAALERCAKTSGECVRDYQAIVWVAVRNRWKDAR